MPLQNRVDPFGALHAVPERGALMGNRGGRLHDAKTKTLRKRRWASKAWIICLCSFKGRHRAVMGRSYTELFFLDEATALSAGHRPCFECQRPRARAFAEAFREANGLPAGGVALIDARLHAERLAAGNPMPVIEASDLEHLPDGAMVAIEGQPHLLHGGKVLEWSFAGYRPARMPHDDTAIGLLTPPSTIAAIRAGFMPSCAASAVAAG